MAIPRHIRQFLNTRMGQVPFLARLGDQIYALQMGYTEGSVDPATGVTLENGIGFSSDSVYGFSTAAASGAVATAGTAVNTNAVAWPQAPKQWSVTGPVGASVESVTYSAGDVTFSVNASATGTVTVYFS